MLGVTAESDAASGKPVGRTGTTAAAVVVVVVADAVDEEPPRQVFEVPHVCEDGQQPPPSEEAQD
jgi:hypothetical protein